MGEEALVAPSVGVGDSLGHPVLSLLFLKAVVHV
jgi:hypothetical protein